MEYRREIKNWDEVTCIDSNTGSSGELIKGKKIVEMSGSYKDLKPSESLKDGKTKIAGLRVSICPRCKKKRYLVKKKMFFKIRWVCMKCGGLFDEK